MLSAPTNGKPALPPVVTHPAAAAKSPAALRQPTADLGVAIAQAAQQLVENVNDLCEMSEMLSKDLNRTHRWALLQAIAALGRETTLVTTRLCNQSEKDRQQRRKITG